MKILLAQLNPVVGAITDNVTRMCATIEHAKRGGAQVIVFPELAVSGYPPKDLLVYPDFVRQCLDANPILTQASDENTLIIWGNIAQTALKRGKPLHNAAYCAWNGQLVALALKNQLPTYDVFDEARYFEPGPADQAVARFSCFGKTFAITVCEDLWSHPCCTSDEKAGITPMQYETDPLAKLREQPVDYLVNLSASPYELGKPALRSRLLKRIAAAEQTTVLYTNQAGANDDLIFDGHSAIIRPDGTQWVATGFQELTEAISDTSLSSYPVAPARSPELELIDALTLGIRDYVTKTGFQTVFIGLSGGIDSALTAALACRALGPAQVIGVAMPGPYSSGHSLTDADALAANLGIALRHHSITPLFESFLALLSNGQRLADLAEQNLQARLRGLILMTLANRENGLVLTTGNKSELATGYSTLYGDSCGALAPLGDLLKTQVYALCAALNQEAGFDLIPRSTLEKPPSAELAPGQLDSDSLPPYPVLDQILNAFLVSQAGFGELRHLGYDGATVAKEVQRVMRNEYKRRQMPPVLKVSRKAFGSGRVFPIVQRFDITAARLGAGNPISPC